MPRTRLIIPVALAAAATYVALVRSETPRRPRLAATAPPSAVEPVGAPAPAADDVIWTEMDGIPDIPAPATSVPADVPDGPLLDAGAFSIGGWAAAPGHSAVSAVTFGTRLPASVGADRIVLEIEFSENVPAGGLVVLDDPGFAPDRDGFTLLLAAEGPGPFSASGTYRAIG